MVYARGGIGFVRADWMQIDREPGSFDAPGSGVQKALLLTEGSMQLAYVRSEDPAEPVALYTEPSAESDCVAELYAGCIVFATQIDGQWALVEPYTYSGLDVPVYMAMDSLAFFTDPMAIEPGMYAATVAGIDATFYRAQPLDAMELDMGMPVCEPEPLPIPEGMLVLVVGRQADRLLVAIGNSVGLMRPEDLVPSMQAVTLNEVQTVLPRLGYALIDGEASFEGAPFELYQSHHYPENQLVERLADLGEWTQVRYLYDSNIGLIKTDSLILLPDMVPGEGSYPAGSYVVGVDMPAGLYTYSSNAYEGQLDIIAPDNAYTRSAKPKGHYTVYLPEGAQVTVGADGALEAMAEQDAIDGQTDWRFSGSARWFALAEIRSAPYMACVIIEAMSEVTQAWYRIEAPMQEAEFIPVMPGESYYIEVNAGEFIEFIDCTVLVDFGRG